MWRAIKLNTKVQSRRPGYASNKHPGISANVEADMPKAKFDANSQPHFNYEAAISFVAADETVANELADLLRHRLSVFIYGPPVPWVQTISPTCITPCAFVKKA